MVSIKTFELSSLRQLFAFFSHEVALVLVLVDVVADVDVGEIKGFDGWWNTAPRNRHPTKR